MSEHVNRERNRATGSTRPTPAEPEPIAIIGLGCRFAGAPDLPSFWRLLAEGRDAVTEVPPNRFPIDEVYDSRPGTPGKLITRWGGFVDGIDQFAASFFGISPREATYMDPAQRWLLEVSWEALEDAGLVPASLVGSRTGVFAGACYGDYEDLMIADPERMNIYANVGGTRSVLANRVSYVLGLMGPSFQVDTGCSSSLVALHLACQSLWTGESDLAIATGVNVILEPEFSMGFSRAGMLAPDGRCKFGDARGDGFVRSDGAAAVVVKRLSDAEAAGDPIYAVIRGSAINNDGKASGYLMTPGSAGQAAVLAEAYAKAGIDPAEVQYVEAHGTGTSTGDPVEIEGLATVLGAAAGRSSDRPLIVGSVKSNIGHTEGAAGLAGVIKAVLAMKHQVIPQTLHVHEPNSHIPWSDYAIELAREPRPWPEGRDRAIAGVTSFGIGGTNGHVILEDYPAPRRGAADPRAQLLPLSADSPAALQDLAARYRDWLRSEVEDAGLPDICATAATRRTHHAHRLAVTAPAAAEMAENLDAFVRDEPVAGHHSGEATSSAARPVVFVFPGQGSHWLGMGQQLLAEEPVFRQTIEEVDAAVRRVAGWSVLKILSAGEAIDRYEEPSIVQPVLFAMEVALAALWRSWGIEPAAVVGHSLGEIAAAHVAGALSLEDAARVVCRRGELMERTRGQGAMAVIEATWEEAEGLVAGQTDRVCVAVGNSTNSTVLSGDPATLDAILERVEAGGRFARRVKIDVASHSPQMDALCPELAAGLRDLTPQPARIPIYSSVEARLVAGTELDAAYWVRNLRCPVRFAETMRQVLADGFDLAIEQSPHPTLIMPIETTAREVGRAFTALTSLRRGGPERQQLLTSFGALYTAGLPVPWERLMDTSRPPVRLPVYTWQRERYWLPEPAQPGRAAHWSGAVHPFIRDGGLAPATQPGTRFWQVDLSLGDVPYVRDHILDGSVIFPAAAYLELALTVANRVFGPGAHMLEDFSFTAALFWDEAEQRTFQIVSTEEGEQRHRLQVYSRATEAAAGNGEWVLHAAGVIRPGADAPAAPEPRDGVEARCAESIPAADHVARILRRGFEFGPSFQGMRLNRRQDGEAIARLELPPVLAHTAALYQIEPAYLDAAFQIVPSTLPTRGGREDRETLVPVGVRRVRMYGRPEPLLWAHARLTHDEPGDSIVRADITLTDKAGDVRFEFEGLQVQSIDQAASAKRPRRIGDWLYTTAWEPAPLLPAPSDAPLAGGSWLILADRNGLGGDLVTTLRARGADCQVVWPDSTPQSQLPVGTEATAVSPVDPAAYHELIRALVNSGRPPYRIVHLWSLDAPRADDPGYDPLAAQQFSSQSLLYLLQAVAGATGAEQPVVWAVTRGAQAAAEGESVAVEQATLHGLARVAISEHPDLQLRRIDLDAGGNGDDAACLLAEFLAEDGEDEVAWRAGSRLARRLVRAPELAERDGAEPGVPATPRPNGTYLITGGLGGLGLTIAGWLVEQGARHLALMGRRPPGPDALRVLDDLAAQGATVLPVTGDVAVAADVQAALEQIEAALPPLAGVIHAAGVLDDGILEQQDAARMRRVMLPKVAGAWNLHSLTAGLPLECFVLFSSVANLVGSPGQSNYAAANEFLDALAADRRSAGLPALSINWGPWSNVGLAARPDRGDRMELRGLRSLSPDDGAAAFGAVLGAPVAGVAIVPMNWQQWRQHYPRVSTASLFATLLTQAAPDAAPVEGEDDRLAGLDPAERQAQVQARIIRQVARILTLPETKVDTGASLVRLGLDSLMAVEVRNWIDGRFGVRVPVSKFLQGISVDALAALVIEQWPNPAEAGVPEEAAPVASEEASESAAALLARVDELSDEEVTRLLEKFSPR